MSKTEYTFFKVLFFLSFFAFGLFYEYIGCIFGGILGIFFVYLSMKKKHMSFYINMESLSISIIVVMYLITCIYGVDAGMGYIGFSKNAAIFFFFCNAMQLSQEQRKEMLNAIPMIGSIMTVIGVVSYGIEPLHQFLFIADRMGGFFQYPNVFAVFCLVGMILLLDRKHIGKEGSIQGVQLIFLMLGIFLSGSRSVFLLMLGVCVVLTVRRKNMRKPLLTILVLMLAGIGIYVGITGNVQNIGRFLTTSLQSSTFLGRILYAKDGMRLLCQNPFGLGYLGYYFMEPAIQRAVYSVRYIHNDFLQMALDIGILPTLFFLWILMRNIFGREKEFRSRLLLAVLALHCLVDFDLEFTSIWLIIILTFDMYRGREINIAAGGKTAFYKITAGIVAILEIYLGIFMIPRYAGYEYITVKFLPFYTEAKAEILTKETDSAKAENMAKELLKQNKYISGAYDVLAVKAYLEEDYRTMADYKEKSIELQKYNIESYERYVIMLSQGISKAGEQGDGETVLYLMEKVVGVPEKIAEVEQKTEKIAYEIRDLPDFQLGEEIADYIDQVEEIVDSYNKQQ